MAKDGLPDPMTKREVIYGKRTWNLSLEECGNQCVKKGQLMDGLSYYLKAEAWEGVEELAQKAIKEGNAFLLERIEVLSKKERPKKDWEKLEENAGEKGKYAYAEKAEKMAEERK